MLYYLVSGCGVTAVNQHQLKKILVTIPNDNGVSGAARIADSEKLNLALHVATAAKNIMPPSTRLRIAWSLANACFPASP
jgi:hypothetical protein